MKNKNTWFDRFCTKICRKLSRGELANTICELFSWKRPFGAQLRYFIQSATKDGVFPGCLQFSSPAWKMAPRDRWIGWNDEQRLRNLQKGINNN